jgi:hypothetical protein
VFDEIGAAITYCFEVTNTGNTHLADVTVTDPDLGINDSDMVLASGDPTLMAPDAVVVWYYETTLDEDLVNTATTTGTPADEDGNEIPATPPSDDDDAEVSEEEVLGNELPRTGFSTRQVATFGAVMLLLGISLLGATGRRERVVSIVTAMGKTPRLWSPDI